MMAVTTCNAQVDPYAHTCPHCGTGTSGRALPAHGPCATSSGIPTEDPKDAGCSADARRHYPSNIVRMWRRSNGEGGPEP